MDRPVLFSIVVPTYNRAHIISSTIESILAQAYAHFEIIIVDDGSTDDTERVVAKYLSEKVFYHKKTNAERGAARNYGTAKAKGDYMNWFDSDDIMYTAHLTEAADMVSRHNHPAIFAVGFQYLDGSGRVFYESNYSPNVNSEFYIGNRLTVDSTFVRRDVALEHTFNEDRQLSGSEDLELWLRLAARYPIYTSSVITVGFIHHDDRSTIRMTDPDRLIDRYTKLHHYLDRDSAVVALLGKKKRFFEMKNYLLLSVDLTNSGHLRLGTRYMAKAFVSSPRVVLERGFLAYLKHFFRHIIS